MKQNAAARLLQYTGVPPLGVSFLAVLSLAWPAIVEQIMITMVQYVDTAMVGSLGSGATAAVGLTASTTWMFNGFLNAAAVGFSVQVAQHIGAGREREARSVTWQALKFVVLFGLFLAVLAAALSFPLPTLLGAEAAIRADATTYFCIIGIALPFNFCSVMLSSILRCAGDMRTPMVLNLLINVFNVILNALLIYPTRPAEIFGMTVTLPGAGLGVAGAALGSACSMMIVSLLYLLVIFRGRRGPLHISLKERFRFERSCLRTALRLGLPVALERTLMSTANIVITGVISSIGTAAVAANHLAVTAESVSYMPAFGVASAGTTLVGQALGAKRKDLALRFSRIATYIGIMIMTLAGAGLFFLAAAAHLNFFHRPRGDGARRAGAAHRRVCGAALCGVDRRHRCSARRGRCEGAVCHQPDYDVGRAHYAFSAARAAVRADRRVDRDGGGAHRARRNLHVPAVFEPLAEHSVVFGKKV